MSITRGFSDRVPRSRKQQLVNADILLVTGFALVGLLVSLLTAIHFPSFTTTLAAALSS